jgi:hypothetical protein
MTLAPIALDSHLRNLRRVHRPPRVRLIASAHSSQNLGPVFGEVCIEAANLHRCSDRCAGVDRLRAWSLSNLSRYLSRLIRFDDFTASK